MEVTIKEFIISLLVFAILALLFSTIDCPDMMPTFGSGTKYLGDSGLSVQGKGDKPANMSESQKEAENKINSKKESPKSLTTDEDESGDENDDAIKKNKESYIEIVKEKDNSMNEVLTAFWHGVMSVLIGEASALLVALAWMKIYKDTDGKIKN